MFFSSFLILRSVVNKLKIFQLKLKKVKIILYIYSKIKLYISLCNNIFALFCGLRLSVWSGVVYLWNMNMMTWMVIVLITLITIVTVTKIMLIMAIV